MALRQSKQAKAREPALSIMEAGCLSVAVGEYVTQTGLALNDVIEMVALPANAVPVRVTLFAEDCDSNGTPLIALDVGYLSGDYLSPSQSRTCGAEFLAASTIARAGGMAASGLQAPFLAAPTTADRSIGIKVQAAAATLTVGAKIRLIVEFAAKPATMASA